MGKGLGRDFYFRVREDFCDLFLKDVYIYILVNIDLIERESSLSRVSTIQYFIFYFYEKE